MSFHTESLFAMIGTAFVMQDYPLYYEAVNEKGPELDAYSRGMGGMGLPGESRRAIR